MAHAQYPNHFWYLEAESVEIDALKLKYAFSGEHPEYPVKEWLAVPIDFHDHTNYWQWVLTQMTKDTKHE